MLQRALLDVRLLPWRPRPRVMNPDRLRSGLDPLSGADDLQGLVVGLVMCLVVIVAAPLIVLVLAAGLLSVELPVVVAIGVLLVAVRFAGLLPWTVVIVDQVTGDERRETYRTLWRAVRRVRSINHDRRVTVRWAHRH